MKFGNYEIKPISVYLPDTQEWQDRDDMAKRVFEREGIADIHWVAGVHISWGIQGRHVYLLDGKPEEQFYIGDKKVCSFLTQYVVYSVMSVMNETHFMFLETDCRFSKGWKEELEIVMQDIPADFDFLFVGSTCAADKEPIQIKGHLYHFPYRGENYWTYYPQGAHCMIIAKKCIPHLITTQRDVATPPDISLIRHAFKDLNIYAILPRLADQGNTVLPL